ncbi:pyridoxamine 5'-phosphate oxidase family protein [Frigidibacter sp. SD6-1]|uniref:pyridoxamine 5'-phosphate oxidase family protein n=1 Tax=Frigidibacter sp. SD6-1 TaxID=3032581 RepID=UPI0024DFC686|nr:pyridoxamine 5'-phosphate oxidase family protein [Frigidibacter sp. SD6-1]
MNTMEKLRADARGTLFDKLEEQRVGMLGLVGSDQHMQPMTHYTDAASAEVWFITSSDTDLVRAVGLGVRAHHCVMTPDGEFYACLSGTLEQSEDSQKLDELWSPVVSAWFEEGRDDPKVTLLRFAPQEAAVWASTDSAMVFGLEVARANLQSDHKPDLGEHMIIRFDGG